MVDWPSTLPQNMLLDEYSSGMPENTLRSSMDTGPAKVRRRSSAQPKRRVGKIFVTDDELDDFKDWYTDDIVDGSLRFDWVDPDDGVTAVEMRFVEAPTWAPVDNDPITGTYWEVMLDLEILP
jgi:hypothetical protein